MTAGDEPFDLSRTFVHLGLGSTATPLPDFAWTPEYLTSYRERYAAEGGQGRLVCLLAQEIDGAERVVPLRPGQAVVNPRNVWHTARVHEPGSALFITPGEGTES